MLVRKVGGILVVYILNGLPESEDYRHRHRYTVIIAAALAVAIVGYKSQTCCS